MTAGLSTGRAEFEFRRQLPAILPRLGRFALALTRAHAEADDVLQAACERAFANLDKWDPDTRLDSWMFRIMQTIWWNELRARKVRERHIDRAWAGPPIVEHAMPEMQLLLVRAEQEIYRLPDELRIVLLLVCVEQLSYREAAEVASIPIGTVMSRLARARLLLMQRLGIAAEPHAAAESPLASISDPAESPLASVSDELTGDVRQPARA